VDEVDVQPINLGQELGEAIEPGLEAPPVVAALPVADQKIWRSPREPLATQSPTVSGSGHRVLASRCFTSSISESGIETVNGRTRAGVGASVRSLPSSLLLSLSKHSATLRCTLVCSLLHCTPVCNNGVVPAESSRVRSMNETRDRILDVALDVLGENPDAGMGDIASAAGVVRRTVYGHFPRASTWFGTLTERAVTEVTAVLTEVNASGARSGRDVGRIHRPRSGRWRTATECCWRCAVASTARRSTACSGQSMSSSPTS